MNQIVEFHVSAKFASICNSFQIFFNSVKPQKCRNYLILNESVVVDSMRFKFVFKIQNFSLDLNIHLSFKYMPEPKNMPEPNVISEFFSLSYYLCFNFIFSVF